MITLLTPCSTKQSACCSCIVNNIQLYMGRSQHEARLGRCQDLNAALQGGVLITIMALTSMAAHRAPGYVPEYVRVIQGRQPEVGTCFTGFRT